MTHSDSTNEQLILELQRLVDEVREASTISPGVFDVIDDRLAVLAFRTTLEYANAKWQHMDPQPKKISLMWQGMVDGTNEAFMMDGMMVIGGADGVTYVTKDNAKEFFDLVEAPNQLDQV